MDEGQNDDLETLEREIKAVQAAPTADTLAFLSNALKRLRLIPFEADPSRRINCLIDIALQFYHQGQSTFDGVEPAALAVMLARDADRSLLRKALTVQSIVLSSTNNPGDALTALSEALEVAEAIDDESGRVAVWNNLGSAFYQAALYGDARDCYERATRLATGSTALRSYKAVALANVAVCCLHMEEYERGLDSIRDSISLRHTPDTPAEMLNRVFAEGAYTRLLLALGRVGEASERAQIAKELAIKAKSVRADVSAAASEGLVEVYSGHSDIGLSRGLAALEKARVIKPLLRETLLSLVQAYEKAGRPDRALAMHRELTLHIRKAQHDSIVRHQELHLRQIEENTEQFPSKLLADKDRELQQKMAEQSVGSRQGELLEQMAFTAEMRDDPTGEHVYRVSRLAALLAKENGAADDVCETIDLAARLHDIGKVAIPDMLMQKVAPLTDGERDIIQTHAATGADLLAKAKLVYSEMAEEIARHHHERWDGNGYPDGISGTAIPLAARIVAICDTYDSLTHEKPYRRAFSSDEAVTEIMRQRELQFDPNLVDIFVPLIARLRSEHEYLDEYLGEAAKNTALNLARQKIAESLAKPIEGFMPPSPPTIQQQPRQQQQRRFVTRPPVKPQ